MGIYFDHKFNIFGPELAIENFLRHYIKKDNQENPIDFQYDVLKQEISKTHLESKPTDGMAEHFLEILIEYGSDEIEITKKSSTCIQIRTCIKGVYLNFVVKHLCEHFPEIDIHLLIADTDWESASLVTAIRGTYNEQTVEITDEIVTELDGQPFEIDQTQIPPSELEKSPPIKLFLRWRQSRLLRELANYPVYAAPYPGHLPTLSDEQAEANAQYFMRTREERILNLKNFLANFKVRTDLSARSITQIDRWLFRYGAFLIPRETGQAFQTHNPSWTGPWRGLNAVFDMATFLGEYIVTKNSNYVWNTYKDVQPGLRKIDPGYRKLVIVRDEPRWVIDVFENLSTSCAALREQSFRWGKPRVSQPKSYLKSVASNILDRPAADTARLNALTSHG